MADVSVRPARPGDIEEIARIQLVSWRVGYAEILPPAVLEAVSEETARGAWQQAVERPPTPRHHVLVALEKDWTVGFVALGPADDEDDGAAAPTDAAVAIGPLLVEPRWGRRGHGSRLLAAAVDTARGDGLTRGVTWIPEGDAPSREFLIGAGWAPDGLVRALDTGAGELREIRLHADLAS
jgi:GNAT superfamily N-acetyltransferase